MSASDQPAKEAGAPARPGLWSILPPILLFAALLAILRLSPANQGGADARYTLLLSEHLIAARSFSLERYFPRPLNPAVHAPPYLPNGLPYHIEETRGHLFYYYPPGSSLLSIPFVAALNVLGWRCSDPSGLYMPLADFAMQRAIATVLMAAFGVLVFAIARLFVGVGPSLVVAIGAVLGSSVYSSSSRALWSDTWAIVLVAGAIWHVARHHVRGDRLRPVLLASVLAWTYYCRPTYSLVVLTVSLWFVWRVRWSRALVFFAVTGLGWLALFVEWSWANFGTLLPRYYLYSRELRFRFVPDGLAGLLLSPGRGLLIYSPAVVFVVGLVVVHWRRMPAKPLAVLALVNIVAHTLLTAAWPVWWGGGCYGPRLMTATVPWFALLAALGLAARGSGGSRVATALGVLLLAASIAIHGRGAVEPATMNLWNPRFLEGPDQVDRLWDWSIVPFLMSAEEMDARPALLRTSLVGDGERFLADGWSVAEGTNRWTQGPRATLCFVVDADASGRARAYAPGDLPHQIAIREALLGCAEAAPANDVNEDGAANVADLVASVIALEQHGRPLPPLASAYTIYLEAASFRPVPGHVQRARVSLNGEPLGEVTLDGLAPDLVRVRIPGSLLKTFNRLELELPDAISPRAAGMNEDPRELGLYVRNLLIR